MSILSTHQAIDQHTVLSPGTNIITQLQITERQLSETDHHDEVWNGDYVMSPIASNNHQRLVYRFCRVLDDCFAGQTVQILPGANLSNQTGNWKSNYRVPDIIVILPGNTIQDCDTHFIGGPDFLVEILSPGDRAVEKLPFYAELDVREVLHVDTSTRATTLFRLQDAQLQLVGESTASNNQTLASAVLPLTFQVQMTADTAQLVIAHGTQSWQV